MSADIVIVFIFFAGPIRGYSPGGRVNNFYLHGRRGNSHFVYPNVKSRSRSFIFMKRVTEGVGQEMGLSRPVFLRIYSLYRLKKFEERTCNITDKKYQSPFHKQL